eukprot:CAMPEP_0180264468 /NCGR_PEP_ID=MMETSP0987-20121128/45826_1 /TAXON_ID=697907 /ORGANISM="non described non described, Strain CCMP2293" /LENGTH=467 /DNA_ID=CAMNT_0022234757 /DNA_START=458 /DNA_END=1859 /DNA_ORIENTATION=-
MRTSHDFLGYLERELALSKRGPWRNGSRGHLTVRTVELNNGGNVRDWFKTHGAYVQAWMLQDASADQQYDRMYRDWGKEIFEKRRFSKNALKEIRANGRQWYRDMGDGIHNEDLHTLDAGLMGESGISSWPAVVVFRDAIIHAHGDIQTQVTFPAASEEFESGIKLAQLCVASFLTGPTRLVGALRFMSRGLVVMFPFSQVVTHRNFLARNYLGVRKCILHPQFFLSKLPLPFLMSPPLLQEFMLAIAGCGSTQKNAIASNFMGPNHDIVISIAQFWGYGYYHFVHENLVRLPLLLNITAKFQQAMVQVIATNTFTMEYIQAFGVPRHRIFKGIAAAKILLVPQPVLCGKPSSMLLRVLRQVALRTTISTSTVAQGPGMPPPGCRILVINRGGGSRRVSNHGSMLTGIMDQHPECELAVHSGKEPLKSQLELFRCAPRSTVLDSYFTGEREHIHPVARGSFPQSTGW